MFTKSFNKLLPAINGKKCIVVSAGKYGMELATELIDKGVEVCCFFDNKKELQGLKAYGLPIMEPQQMLGENYSYIIAIDDGYGRYCLKEQLRELGILDEEIMIYYPRRCLDYHSSLRPQEYKGEINEVFKEEFGYEMNWDNPKTYNEKMNWEKLNLQDNRRTELADKDKVRDWVADKIGDVHLTKQLGRWKCAEDIDFNSLPNSFVLKTNNGSSRNILVKNKNDIDKTEVIKKLTYWLNSNYMFENFENHYGDILPCVIAEEYLDGMAENLYDYNIFCFHGKPVYIWCIKGSHRPGCCATFYDTDWNMQPFSYGYPLDINPAPKPDKLEEMLELTQKLCSDFEHVRVDWYLMPDGRILFGEMTFQTWGGVKKIIPHKYDYYLGSLI